MWLFRGLVIAALDPHVSNEDLGQDVLDMMREQGSPAGLLLLPRSMELSMPLSLREMWAGLGMGLVPLRDDTPEVAAQRVGQAHNARRMDMERMLPTAARAFMPS